VSVEKILIITNFYGYPTHLLQIIGEAARRVSPDFRENYPTIPWQAVVGMRSKVVHDYLNVDEDIVWNTVKNDLPFLVKELEKILIR
jgi:uncharacterized protein with HEPN domain